MRVMFWGVLAGVNLYTTVTSFALGNYGWAVGAALLTAWCMFQGQRRVSA